MDLEEFVSQTIQSIVNGMSKAQTTTGKFVAFRTSEKHGFRDIEFDVAVSAEQKGATEGGAKVKVLSFFEAGGSKASETKNSAVSRIKFGMMVR